MSIKKCHYYKQSVSCTVLGPIFSTCSGLGWVSQLMRWIGSNKMNRWTTLTWISRYLKGETSLHLNEAGYDGGFGMVVASAGPHASNVHLAPER